MKHFAWWLILLLPSAGALAQRPTVFERPQSDHRVSYTIDVSLDAEARALHATGQITWRNPDSAPVDTLQFHLYLNAFQNAESTFMRESGGAHRGFSSQDGWGDIRILRLGMYDQADSLLDLTDRITFIQPDDGNVDDETVAAFLLPDPVAPGAAITLDVAFEASLPQIVARTGYLEKPDGTPFFMVAQWFPKLGVFEIPGQRFVPEDAERGRWNTHQFHANSEFYADFGAYDITIDVPEDFVVGATGVRVDERRSEGRRTVRYYAEDVHDFAWTASPGFRAFTDHWRHVSLRLLVQPEHANQAQRHFDAAKLALDQYDALLGLYPYTTLTLVDGLGGANGMEYPTLITCGTRYGLPAWARFLELVTIHEFGHQYFYGMLASNEFEEAWLDEGFNSYLETRIMDEAFGPGSVVSLPGIRINDGHAQRIFYAHSTPERGALFTRSWEYAVDADYGKASYSKAATVMTTLEGYLGWPVMQRFLRAYYERWRFRHPTTVDVQEVMEDVAGEDLAWFFDQYVYGTAVVDYAVAQVDTDEAQKSRVRVERRGDGVFPQTLQVRFQDGRTDERRWDGQDASRTFVFERSSPVVEAYIDPADLLWLDIDRLNNRWTTQPSSTFALKHAAKFSGWMQNLLHLLGTFF